jgi:dolichol-phosphate mannosyltransferase
MKRPELSLIVPTFNERGSIRPLLTELEQTLQGTDWEVLFMDDSTDNTPEVINAHAQRNPRVRMVHRDENRGGLAGAVVEGLARARGQYLCVLDADLQHPPARIPEMLAAARESNADVVVASRYVPGGSAGGLDGPMRQMYSRGLKALSKCVFPRRLAGITDPLGGYFLLHRSVIRGAYLRPIGYKILLEILIRCPWRTSREVPYRFQPRQHDASKADFRQGLRFLQHLTTLAYDCSPVLGPLRAFDTRPVVGGQRLPTSVAGGV